MHVGEFSASVNRGLVEYETKRGNGKGETITVLEGGHFVSKDKHADGQEETG